jgi:predicted nucleic acid-binding protein
MILVDASVWIDYLSGTRNSTTQVLDTLLLDGSSPVAMADLVVFEVLRGFRSGRQLDQARMLFMTLPQLEIGGLHNAVEAADHYRALRSAGYTISSPIDVLLASYCISHGHVLLHRDADFDAIEALRGLKTWPH